MLTRVYDWPEQLRKVVTEARSKTFEWGVHDCALFAADCVQALTGTDFAESFRGQYDSKKGAIAALQKFGKGNLPDTVSNYLGEPTLLTFIGRGDIVEVKNPNDNLTTLGVVVDHKAACLEIGGGIKLLGRESWIRGWKV